MPALPPRRSLRRRVRFLSGAAVVALALAAFAPSPGRGVRTAEADCPAPGTVLFPGVKGAALQESLRVHYRPPVNLSYAGARDVLYTLIDNHDGQLSGIYTGFTIPLDPDDPSPRATAFARGINAEHTWPQSKGAGNLPAEADMHQLRPSEITANGDRGSFPFAEIPDDETDVWYRDNLKTTTPDPGHEDEYSELDRSYPGTVYDGRWEPRESVKGDVARGMFYFYTVYRSEADAADPAFFGVQKNDLRSWTLADPADDAEYARTCAIAPYQGDRPNPFVIDPSLVDRAYFPDTAVRLASFRAQAGEGAVRLVWETSREDGHAGFHVLRAVGNAETRLTPALLGPGPRYAFVDRTGEPGTVYGYWLEAVDRDGGRERFGPRIVRFPDPGFAVRVLGNPMRAGESVRVEVDGAGGAPVAAALYDLSGRRVRAWPEAPVDAVTWDGRGGDGAEAAPGVYFLRVTAGGSSRAVRLVRVR